MYLESFVILILTNKFLEKLPASLKKTCMWMMKMMMKKPVMKRTCDSEPNCVGTPILKT